jgi:hypothetical protein
MPEIQIADKPTLDSVNTKVGATGDAANAAGSIFARLAEMLTNRLTAARAAFLDAAISTRAAAATALSTAQWTNTRAGYLDQIPNLLSNVNRQLIRGNATTTVTTPWATLLNVSGFAGKLKGIRIAFTNPDTAERYGYIQITLDGSVIIIGKGGGSQSGTITGAPSATFPFNSSTSNYWAFILQTSGQSSPMGVVWDLPFSNSLKIEGYITPGATSLLVEWLYERS